jgi:hypothetical protein
MTSLSSIHFGTPPKDFCISNTICTTCSKIDPRSLSGPPTSCSECSLDGDICGNSLFDKWALASGLTAPACGDMMNTACTTCNDIDPHSLSEPPQLCWVPAPNGNICGNFLFDKWTMNSIIGTECTTLLHRKGTLTPSDLLAEC